MKKSKNIKLLVRLFYLVLLISFSIILTLIIIIINNINTNLIFDGIMCSNFMITAFIMAYLTILIDRIKESEFIKDEFFNIKNHKSIIHEIVHVKIHEKFGFKKWKIVSKNDHRDLICVMTLPENVLFLKYFPKIFLWEFAHFIHDVFLRFFIMDIINIIEYTKEFFLNNMEIIKEIIKKTKEVMK